MKKRNIIYIILALLTGFYLAYLSTRPNDFDVFMDAALKIKAGADPYGPPYIRYLHYFYSPFFAFVLLTLSWIPLPLIKWLWLVFNLFAWWRTWSLFQDYFPDTLLDEQKKKWFWSVLILTIYFALLNLQATQLTIVIVWASWESIALAKKDKALLAGILLGVFINIKLLPLPFFVYMIYRGYFKASIYTVLTFIFLLFLPAIYVGWKPNLDMLISWWNTINPQNMEHTIETGSGWHSLSAMLPSYVSPEHLPNALLAARLFFMGFTLYFLNSVPFSSPKSEFSQFREMAYLSLVIPLIFPHQRFYDFYFLFPLFTYNIHFLMYQYKKIPGKIFFIYFGFFAIGTILLFLGRDLVGDTIYTWIYKYHLMTWAVIILAIDLALLSPRRIKPQEGNWGV